MSAIASGDEGLPQARAGDALDERDHHQHTDEQPVEPADRRCVGWARLVPEGAPHNRHGASVGTRSASRTRRVKDPVAALDRGHVQAVRRMRASTTSSAAKPRP